MASGQETRPQWPLLWMLPSAALMGLFTAQAYAPTNVASFAFVGPLGLWLLVSATPRTRTAAAVALAYALPYFWRSLSYLDILGSVAVGALALFQSLFVVGAITLYRWSREGAPAWLIPLLGAAAWTLADLARANVGGLSLTMSNLGVALDRYPLAIQSADLGGVHLITFLVAWTSAAVAEGLRQLAGPDKNRRAALAACLPVLLAWGANLGYGALRLNQNFPGETMKIAVCQPAERIQGYYGRVAMSGTHHEVAAYRGLLSEPRGSDPDTGERLPPIMDPELILFPESGVSDDIVTSQFARGIVAKLAAQYDAHIITGCHRNENGTRYNSVVHISPDGEVRGQYHKRHIVAFGEFLYFREKLDWLYRHYPIRPYDLSPGTEISVFDVNGHAVAPVICFESIFPGETRKSLRAGGELLVVHTNDGWFNSEMEAQQHARASVFRAIEGRVDVVRAASTAYSGHIDCYGRWQVAVPRDVSRAILVEPTLRPARSVFLLVGSGPLWVLCPALLAGWLVIRTTHRRRGSPDEEGTG